MSQLPPPPPSWPPAQPGGAAWAPLTPAAPDRPAWRTAKVGWVILHIVIGLGIGVGVFFVVMLAIAAGHFDLQTVDAMLKASRASNYLGPGEQRILAAIGGGFMVSLAASVLGWLLFVYLRAGTVMRIILVIALPLAGAAVGYAMMAAALPKLAGY